MNEEFKKILDIMRQPLVWDDDGYTCSRGDDCPNIETFAEVEMRPERYFNIIKNKKQWDGECNE